MIELILAAIIAAPACQSDWCNPDPWNGQLQQTWNTPGYYGGWTTGPVVCDPFTTTCRGVIPNP